MWLRWYFWLGAGSVLLLIAWRVLRSNRSPVKAWKFFTGSLCAALSVAAIAIGGYLASWYQERATAIDQELFKGTRHVRLILTEPRRIVANLVFIDLNEVTLESHVTAPDPDLSPKLRAATVGQFLERNRLQLAINANFFDPFHSNSPWDFYPQSGDPVTVLGTAASSGNIYSTQVWAGATIFLSRQNRVQMGGTATNIWNAVSGDQWLIQHGTNVAKADHFGVYPRAAVGFHSARNKLILAVIDGKQPGFSEGMTLPELAELFRSHGAHHAINLDGGGSVTLVAADRHGKALVLNSPIHTRIPGRQRPVANHLGFRANH